MPTRIGMNRELLFTVARWCIDIVARKDESELEGRKGVDYVDSESVKPGAARSLMSDSFRNSIIMGAHLEHRGCASDSEQRSTAPAIQDGG
jgi:hypothetical protein